MNAPVQIRKPEVVERLRRLAEAEGKSITELVEDMVRERDRQFEAEVQRKIAAVEEIVAHFNSLPIVGALLTDDDLYDEDGLPK